MSTEYYVYLEANIDGEWRCISPAFPSLEYLHNKEKKDDEYYAWKRDPDAVRYAMIDWNGSVFRNFVDECCWDIDYNEISSDLLHSLYSDETIREFDEAENNWDKPLFKVCYDLESCASEKCNRHGYVTKEEAEQIRNGGYNGEIYPVSYAEALYSLSEYDSDTKIDGQLAAALFDKFYEEMEWTDDESALGVAKRLLVKVNMILGMVDDVTPYGCTVKISDCRLVIRVSY